MNKLMTAVLGLTLMAGSAAFAQTATDTIAPQSSDSKMATTTPKVKKAKKHTKKAPATTDVATPAANPTK